MSVIGQLYFNYSSITHLFVSSILKLIIERIFNNFFNNNGGRCIYTT